MGQDIEIKVNRSPKDIDKAIVLRKEIFASEQGILSENEHDKLDDEAHHAVAYVNDQLIETARLVVDENRSGIIARVAVIKNKRKCGVGKMLLKSLENEAEKLGLRSITIFAHKHLQPYYESLDYKFLEFGEIVFGHQLIKMGKDIYL